MSQNATIDPSEASGSDPRQLSLEILSQQSTAQSCLKVIDDRQKGIINNPAAVIQLFDLLSDPSAKGALTRFLEQLSEVEHDRITAEHWGGIQASLGQTEWDRNADHERDRERVDDAQGQPSNKRPYEVIAGEDDEPSVKIWISPRNVNKK